MSLFGAYMKTTSVPMNFIMGGRPDPWLPSERFGQPTDTPLVDEGTLLRSVGFEAASDHLDLGAGSTSLITLRKAAVLQFGTEGLPGGAIKPKKKFLVRPIVGPGALTEGEARTKSPRMFPNLFVDMEGPAGPGLYRKTSKFSTWTRGQGRTKYPAVLIFAFMKSVKIPARPYLLFQEQDVLWFGDKALAWMSGDPDWRTAS